jgi:hypothetical protein
MHPTDIAHARLHNQRLADNLLEAPVDGVRWLGAVVLARAAPGAHSCLSSRHGFRPNHEPSAQADITSS